jgi:hypothetical protein
MIAHKGPNRAQNRETEMKTTILGIVAALMMMASISEAGAVVCARGMYRAGCVGRHGAAVVRRPVYHGGAVVVGRHCHYRGGVRVCR